MEMRKIYPIIATIAVIMLGMSGCAYAGTYFWLHDDSIPETSAELMDSSDPRKSIDSIVDLNDDDARWYTAPFEEDQHINGDVEILLWIEASSMLDIIPLQFRVIRMHLVDVSPSLSENEIESSRASPFYFLSNDTIKTAEFTLNVDHVIPAGHRLGIRVEKSFDFFSFLPINLVSPFFSTNVLYDSIYHNSHIFVPFNATGEAIEINSYPQTREVNAGEEATYNVIIYNNGPQDDVITFSYLVNEQRGDNEWTVTFASSQLEVEGNYLNSSYVTVAAPHTAIPGDFFNITLTAIGTTGSDSIWLNTSVAEPTYGVDVKGEGGKQGEPGDKLIYTFTVKNIGDLSDAYDFSVACDWTTTLEKTSISLDEGDSALIEVEVEIPMDAENGTQTQLVFTAESQNSSKQDSTTVTTTVKFIAGEEKESFWENLFGNFGKRAGYILFILLVVALLIIAAFLTRLAKKFSALSCDERLQEVPPGHSAHYHIHIKNILEKETRGKNKMTYKLSAGGDIPENWKTEFEEDTITLEGGEEKDIEFTVETSPDSVLDDWASIDIAATPSKKTAKSEKINIVTLLREPKPHLEIAEVTHEPEAFVEGEKVLSHIRIVNTGEAHADQATITLLVNEKEKNRVEGLHIPVNGRLEVKIPWYPEEGENRVTIKLT